MAVLSSISACSPALPTRAAAPLALRSPRSVVLEVQADRFPDSNPSAKMRPDGGAWCRIYCDVHRGRVAQGSAVADFIDEAVGTAEVEVGCVVEAAVAVVDQRP